MWDVSPQLHRPSQIGFENPHSGIGLAESGGSRKALRRASRPTLGLLDICINSLVTMGRYEYICTESRKFQLRVPSI